jgi:hypothetical protein
VPAGGEIFPNCEWCPRSVPASAVKHVEEWITGRRYLNTRDLKEHHRAEWEAEGVALLKR